MTSHGSRRQETDRRCPHGLRRIRPATPDARSMLLLPLLFYWARSPMYFSPPIRRSCIAAIFGICFAAPPASMLLAADGLSDSVAPTIPGWGTTTSADIGPIVRPTAGHLREGTQVKELTGRFLLVGRRWAFLPDRPPAPPVAPELAPIAAKSNSQTVTTYRETQAAGQRSVTIRSTTSQSAAEAQPSTPPVQAELQWISQLLVVENQMLQRVVEAIRATPSDDRWMISGEVTEFFDENRLLLKTVQRAAIPEPN